MERVLEVLDRLIGFETVSAASNLHMVDYIEAFCASHGAKTTRVLSPSGTKAGLVARFGPDAPGGVILSGHTDVVPTQGQAWSRAPFAMTREGDCLFGRGTTDMKGFLACMMEAGRNAGALRAPLTLVFSYDEEVGCVGIAEMAEHLPPLLGAPQLCIVGEPTEMQIATGHKGKAGLRARCRGQNGHSAMAPQFVNALDLAVDFSLELRALQAWYVSEGAQDDAYDVPYTTLHVGKMTGGTALNIVPDSAELTFEYRYLPEDGGPAVLARIEALAEAVSARYRAGFAGAGIEIERFMGYPGLEISQSSEAARTLQSLAPKAEFTKVAFGTEAGVFHQMGIETLVCGPGSMAGQGHKPDEFIELSQLASCVSMLERVTDTLR